MTEKYADPSDIERQGLAQIGSEIEALTKDLPDERVPGLYAYRFNLADRSEVTLALNKHEKSETLQPEFIVVRKPSGGKKQKKPEIYKWQPDARSGLDEDARQKITGWLAAAREVKSDG